ncbi:MAG: hypothetical protein JSV22_11250 [Bacteroidales bacterium]|nr:MAG: hypothetical protein JSV22_11250 [Bacteroidales bacterium]
MNKRIFMLLSVVFVLIVTISAQEQIKHEKKVFISPKGRIYIQKALPVYLKISTSPEDNARSYLLKSEVTTRYSNPMYFDTEGYNTIRSPWRVDTTTKKPIYPQQDIIFEVYADGYPPKSKTKYTGTSKYIKDGINYYSGAIEIAITAVDGLSGVDKIYYSINNEDFKAYSESIPFSDEGKYTLKYYSVDNVGNVEEVKTESFIIDLTYPQTVYEIDGLLNENYISPDARIVLKSTDSLSGVNAIYYQINNGKVLKYISPIPVSVLGSESGNIAFYGIDNTGNKENIKVIGSFPSKNSSDERAGDHEIVFEFYIDNKPPEVLLDFKGNKHKGKYLYISPDTKVSLTAKDDKSGVDKIKYGINSSLVLNEYNEPFNINNSGLQSVFYTAIDFVGNWTSLKKEKVFVDLNPPNTSFNLTGLNFFNRDTLYITKDTKILIDVIDDESGINKIYYKIDNEEYIEYTSPVLIEKEGFHKITYYGVDNVNNEEEHKIKGVFVDITPPDIHYQFNVAPIGSKIIRDEEFVVYPTNAVIYLGSTDYASGGKRIEYIINNSHVKTELPITNFKPGNYLIDIFAYDELNNKQVSKLKFSIEN